MLADGSVRAPARLHPSVDPATLTGAVVVALGSANAGVFANDDPLYERFRHALDKAGEKFWRLPLDEEYQEPIRSNIADLVNAAGVGAEPAAPLSS